MKYTYEITGMTCASCEDKVKNLLLNVKGIKNVNADKTLGQVEIEMVHELPIQQLNAAFENHPKYRIMEPKLITTPMYLEPKQAWYITYKPLLTVFVFILIVSLSVTLAGGHGVMHWMNYFMAGFFITFSFFKFLNLRGFADSYAMYDVIAMKWKGWSYVYAFIELALGVAFITGIAPVAVNVFTFLIMGVSLIGVVKSVMDDRKIKCACLGDVFNLPMSNITIIEDGLMMAMSLIMVMFLN